MHLKIGIDNSWSPVEGGTGCIYNVVSSGKDMWLLLRPVEGIGFLKQWHVFTSNVAGLISARMFIEKAEIKKEISI
jgi:hypothetical protein